MEGVGWLWLVGTLRCVRASFCQGRPGSWGSCLTAWNRWHESPQEGTGLHQIGSRVRQPSETVRRCVLEVRQKHDDRHACAVLFGGACVRVVTEACVGAVWLTSSSESKPCAAVRSAFSLMYCFFHRPTYLSQVFFINARRSFSSLSSSPAKHRVASACCDWRGCGGQQLRRSARAECATSSSSCVVPCRAAPTHFVYFKIQ